MQCERVVLQFETYAPEARDYHTLPYGWDTDTYNYAYEPWLYIRKRKSGRWAPDWWSNDFDHLSTWMIREGSTEVILWKR